MQHNTCSAYFRPALFAGLIFWLSLFPGKVGSMNFYFNTTIESNLLLPPANLTQTYTVPGSYTFTIPEGVTSITVQTWGGGGRGGSRTTSTDGTGGGGGGAFSQHTFTVIPGNSYVVVVGSGSSSNTAPGGDSWVSLTDVAGASVLAKGGNSVANNSNTAATGGSAASGIGAIRYSGGNGANRVSSTSSGGGGSSAGTGANGNNASGTTAGSAPSGGANGGAGRTSVGSGNAGLYPGGGGGGAVRGTSGSPSGGTGGHGRVIISYTYNVDAGLDQSQCNNSLFYVNTATPPSGYTSTWSVVSGTGFIYDNSKLNTSIIVPAGFSATVRLTMTNGTVTATDDLVLTNTTSCSPTCTAPLNENGNLESSGTITSYNLSFQGTPAALIYQNTNPNGWSEAYGSATPNTTSFTGAYHLNKTGSNGNPKSGSKFLYMAGSGFCLSALKTGATLHCGKTYRVSVWVAAYSNSATQANSPFFLEFFSGGTNMPGISIAHQAIAPASSSWNNLNWQRYSFEFTVPTEGYQWADFVFTTLHNTNGIVVDDMCIEEIFSGSEAAAGQDVFGCSNTVTMSANTPTSGFSGQWSVLSGNATIANPTSPTSNVTITSGTAARLRWTVSSTSGGSTITALDPKKEGGFENCCTAYDNGWTAVNHTTNQWHVGSASNPTSGNRAAYISNNSGTSYAYTLTTAQTSHLYRDIVVAPGASNIQLTFKWKGQGQSGTDRLLVYTAPTNITPSAGTPSSTSTTLSGATLVSGTNLHLLANYETVNITLPNALAGTTFRLIFTWQNNASSGVNPPVSIDEVGVYYNFATCSSSDEVNIGYAAAGSLSVNNPSICPGESAVLTATGCSGGNLLWSNGSTQSSITVNPTSTTSYSVTCTPGSPTNILQNPGLESTTNLQNWDNWGNASITTNGSDVYQGSKAIIINTIGQSWGGVAQGFAATPGRRYRVRAYAKTTNTNILPAIKYEFYNGGSVIENQTGVFITSNNYQLYEFEVVSPPNVTWMTVFAEIGQGGQLFLDNWEVISTSTCNAVQTSTVTVLPSQNITLSNINVTNCTNHPLQDVAQVSVRVAWNAAPANDYLGVTIQNKTEYINVGGGATSPQTLTFLVPANGQTNIPITARWYFNPNFGCPNSATFNAPNACSNDVLTCNILYLCGLDKPADGDAFDHGLIEYIMANNSGNLLPALVKDNGTANDFYDPNDQNTPISVNLNDYDMIIISPTTQGYVSTRLRDILLPFKGSILNMNYLLQQGLETTNGAGYFAWGNTAFTNATQSVSIYNYDNINPSYALVKTGGTTKAGAASSLWFNAGDANGLTNAMAYSYKAHSIPGVSTTHGLRQYLGLHMNGLYANSQNGGSLPAPASSYFHPARHLTPEMKIILDQTLKNVGICQSEICANLTDDDEDDLTDCNDPDCWKITNREFDEGTAGWDLYNQNGAASTRTVDNTSQLSGKNSMRINISAATGTNWHIQFLQSNILLEAGKSYQVSFMGRAAANRTITVFTDLGASPFTTYFSQNVNLTSAAQTFTFTYTQNATTSIGRLGFNLGQSNQTVWIDNVIFTEVCQIPEICDNGLDDNGNGLSDCSDPDCPCCNTLTAGGIVTGNQIECQNYNPGIISSTSPASGGSGTIVYQWEYSNDEVNWVEIPGATGLTYDPGMVYQTTYYRRKARLNTCNLWGVYSNTVIKQNLGFDNFQILTRNNTTFNGGTHVHGPMAVGGNLVINSNGAKVEVNMDNTGTYIFPGDGSTTTGLMVKGGITFQSGYLGILSNRYVHIGNSANLASGDNNTNSATQVYPAGTGYNHSQRIETTIDQTPNPAVFQNVAYDFEALFDLYHNSSIDLGARTNNVQLFNTSNVVITNNNVTFGQAVRINTLNTGYNYLNLTTTSLNNITEMNFNGSGVPSSTKILVINVLVNSNFTWNNSNMPGLSAPTTAPYMIWNFYGPTTNTVTINNSSLIFGTIFAPNQNVLKVGQNDIEGSVIAKSFSVGNGQLHDFMFANFCDILDCVENVDVSITGPTDICSGTTATLTASGGQSYLWSNGATTATINVTTSGTYTVTVTSDVGCTGTASRVVNVLSNPTVPIVGTITQPTCTVNTGSVILNGLPSTGTWTLTRTPGGTTYTGTGTSFTVTGLPASIVFTFTVTNQNNCVSPASANVTINASILPPAIGGATSGCTGLTVNVTPNSLGSWTSSNNGVATVTNAGVVTGVSAGTVTLTYTRTSDGCTNNTPFTVYATPAAPVIGTIIQPTCTNTTGSVSLSGLPATGSWTITRNPGGTTYTGSGTTFSVTGLPANTTYTFTITNSVNCTSVSSSNVVINAVPANPVLGGASSVCVGSTANVTPNTAGTWTSSNTGIATITNAGIVTGVSAGSVTLTYIRTADGCSNNIPFTVHSNPTAPVTGAVTQPTCTVPTGSVVLSGLPATGSWTITRTPGGTTYTGSGTSFTVTGLPANTSYTFTVTNSNLCTSLASANVVINAIPTNPVTGGSSSLCVGATANVTPSTSGSWSSSNNAIATVTNAGVVTGVSAGSVTLTYTRTSDGCSNTRPFTVQPNPTAPLAGTITQPTCIVTTGSVVLNSLPSTGSWTIVRTPGGNTYTGTGTSFTVTGLPANTTYSFSVTNSNSCSSPPSTNIVINSVPAIPVIGGAASVCVGATANVTPGTSGTWSSSNTAIVTITNAGVVTGLAAGSVTLTYNRTADGCSNAIPFTVHANPTVPVLSTITQPTCLITTGSVFLNGLPSTGSWTVTRTPGGNTYTGSGTSYTVTGLPANTTYTFTVTNSNLCTSPSSANAVINPIPTNPVIGGATSVCVGLTTNVTPSTSGTWISSNTSVATITNAGTVSSISVGTVTLTYTRTSDGCSNSIPFTVHANPTPPVIGTITQPTCITPTGSVVLSSLPSSGSWTITRSPGGITYTGSGTSYTVTGLPANATYTFTVTNSNTCVSAASTNAVVSALPVNPVLGGATAVCVGSTANVTPNTAGTWTSSNNVIATITNGGVVSGVTSGTVTLTYTRTSDGCSNTSNFVVHALPVAVITGDNYICTGLSTTLTAAGGTSYVWQTGQNTSVITVSPTTVTTYIVTVTNVNGCTNTASYLVQQYPTFTATATSPTQNICAGQDLVLNGLMTNGVLRETYTGISGTLVNDLTSHISYPSGPNVREIRTNTIGPNGVGENYGTRVRYYFTPQVSGDHQFVIYGDDETILYWSGSDATSPLTILANVPGWTNEGELTRFASQTSQLVNLTAGQQYYFELLHKEGGGGDHYGILYRLAGGPGFINIPESTVSPIKISWTGPDSYTSSNVNNVISNTTTSNGGTYTLTGTDLFGCQVTSDVNITVNVNPTEPVVGTITQPTCTTPTGSVVLNGLPASGSWTITRTPGVITYTGTGTSYTVTGLPVNTTYSFTITNTNSCISPASADVTINAIPSNPTLGGASAVCVGSTANVTPAAGGTWVSSNTSFATITNAGVVTGVAAGSVTLTYTRTSDGCSNTLPFTVNANPTAPVVGTITQPTCSTPSGSVILSGLPSVGSWTITRTPGSNTYSGSGTSYTVTGLPANESYTFTVINVNNCASASSMNVAINSIPGAPVLGGTLTICQGGTTNVTPSVNGTWTSSNPAIASVTNGGVVSGLTAGAVTLTYTRTSDGCSNTLPFTVYANPSAPVVGTITQPTCTTPTGSVVLSGLPASGSWTITRTPGGTTYSGSGTSYTVTGLPVNTTYTFTVTNSNSCVSPSSTNVVINPIPANPVTGGASSVCVGLTANVTPATAGSWASSNNAIATITNAGVVTGVAAGSVTLTYTRTSDGCSNTRPFTVNANPTAPVVGVVTQPTCTTPTGSVVLSGLPSIGSWTITRTPGGTTYSGSGTSNTVTGLPVNTTYTFTVTNSNSCVSPSSTNVVINPIPANPVTGGASSVCVGITANVTPATAGTWTSSNTGIATITNSGAVTGIAAGSVTLTYTRTSDGCSNTRPFTVNANPTAPVVGVVTQPTCTTPTGSVVLSGLPSTGSWTITRTPGGTTYSGSGTSNTVTGLPVNTTYTFTVTNSNTCVSPSSTNVNINPIPANPVTGGASIVCVGSTANVTPATAGTWTSSNTGIATITNSGAVTGIAAGSVTLTYTRTSDGCSNTRPFTVNANPTVPVLVSVTQPTCIIPTGSVSLSGLPSTGSWTITRTPGGTTYSGSGTSNTITGLPVNTTYTFTVTNSNLCTSPSSSNVVIDPIPATPVTGGENSVCAGLTANVNPSSEGTWTSSNTSVASITNAGLVTGIAAGSVILTYTRNSDGCSNTLPFTVFANPTAPLVGTIIQPTCITTTGSVQLNNLPATGSWTLTRTPGGTTYIDSGNTHTVAGLTANTTYSFTVVNDNNCTSPASVNVVINSIPTDPVTGGENSVCAGLTANVTPSTDGFWTSSNTSVATISNSGLVSGISAGSVTLTYTRNSDGCNNTLPFTVHSIPSSPLAATITQPTCITTTGSVELNDLPGSGSWTLQRTPGGTTYTGSGTTYNVTGLPANANYTFTLVNANNCTSLPSSNIVINDIPSDPVLGGESFVCLGSDANVTPNTLGSWSTTNNAIASITNDGLVTGVSAGTVTLTYTRTADGCFETMPFTVYENPSPPLTGQVIQPTCTTPTGSLMLSGLPSSGNWMITSYPGGNTFTSSGSTYNISGLLPDDTYTFVVTDDRNCTSPTSATIVIDPVPSNPIPGGDTTICVGSIANVTPASGGVWTSSNQTVATITNEGFVTGVSAGSVTLTYTRTTDGCSNTMIFNVNGNPTAPIVVTITQPTCYVPFGSVQLNGLPSSGSWILTRTPGNVTYPGSGISYVVDSLAPDATYTFNITNDNGCISSLSNQVVINAIPGSPNVGGPTSICIGTTTNVTPSSGGTWVSSNNSRATVSNEGLVTSLSAGITTLTYTRTSDGCSNSLPLTINVNPTPPVVGITTQPTCTSPTGSVDFSGLPSTGIWTMTRSPGDVTYNGTGTNFTVSGLAPDATYSFIVRNQNNCTSTTSNNVVINPVPSNPVPGGAPSVCIGSTANVTPASNGTWTSNNPSIASITNIGVVTGITAGSVTLTYVRTADGCTGNIPFSVFTNPTTPVAGTVTQPTCTNPTGSVVLSGLPSLGSWTVVRNPGGITYSGSGSTFTITGLPPNATYSFAVTNENLCTSLNSNNVVIQPIPSNPVLGGPDLVCVGNTASMTPATNGTWNSSNTSVATISNAGLVTGISAGNVTLTYTRSVDGCINSKSFIVYDNPTAPVAGSITQPNCLTMTGSVMLNNLPLFGSWTIIRSPGGTTYTGSGGSYLVTGLPPSGTYTFTVTTSTNCISPASNQVVINGIPSNPGVTINYDGSLCLTDNKQLIAVPTGGLSPYTYQWSGPSGFTALNENINITQNGNYSVTVTDANFCTATTNGFVYARYEPFIVTINATICEGDEVDLDVSSTTAVSFLWSANAGSATTRNVTVTPAYPSATYFVTVTNDLGCTAVPEINILVNPKPTVTVSGPEEICVGQNSQMTPSTGGFWVSTNPSVAHISSTGLVTGLSPGTSSFIFTENVFGCSSDASIPVLVNPKPVVNFTGLNPICVGDTTTLTPSSEGTWSSSNPVVATITDSGVATGLSAGFVTFIYTNNSTNCSSNASVPLQVQSLPVVVISGPETACIGTNASFSVNHTGGIWSTSNPLTATINNSGTLITIDTGLVTVYYSFVSGACEGVVSKEFRIFELPSVQFAGPAEICVGQTTSLTPAEGGVWTSSNPLIASITPEGLVSGLTSGYAAFTFVHDSTGCISETSGTLTVFAKPNIALNGPSGICVGGTSQFLPFSGGVWQTNNPFVANITNGGIVSGIGPGTATFSFVHDETGCVSDTSVVIQVGSAPTATIDFQGSVCVENNKTIRVQPSGGTAPYAYSWIGPLGFTGNTQVINVVNNGTYFVTITDNFGCKTNVSGFVHQRFEPVIVNLSTQVCEGQTTNLSVNASSATSFLWSSNAGNAITPSVTVTPVLPSSVYLVTVTNNLGCQAVAQANVLVNPKPIVSISGPNILCVGQTSNVLPNSGGIWVSLNPGLASITNTGVVTAFQPGNARFLFTQISTGCVSDTTGIITINPITTTSFSSVSELCIGQQTNLLPNAGGSWTALHPTIANITSNGTVTALTQGNAQFRFTNSFGCVTPVNLSIRINSIPVIVLDGPQQICTGSVTALLPSSGGTWVSSNPLIASVTNTGTVMGISPGSARFLFTNSLTGCRSDSSAIVTVVAGSPVSVTGPTSICAGATTTLSPTSGGSWVSQNPAVATVNNSGVVTGINTGTATFIFTSAISGCPSSPTVPVTVNPRPTISITGNNTICIGQTTTLQPTSGGTWTSSNLSVANITSSGVVTGLASGLVNFTFTSAATGCVSLPSGNINVNPKPLTSVTNTNICIGSTTNLQPSTGGSWISLQPAVASVNTGGIVTGISTGTAQFRFTDALTGCVSDPTPVHNVSPKPVVSVTGTTEFCQGTTTQLSPVSGGSWTSLNPSVATVTNTGVVTGISAGTARFVFTSNQGCSSDPTQQIIINAKPLTVFVGGTEICVGSTTQLSPGTGGSWISARNNIATITNSGLVTGLAPGTTNFVFVNANTGCTSDSTINVVVNPAPTPGRLGSGTVCIGQTVQLTPTAGGTWTTLSPDVAIVSSSGLVTGIGSGVASFKFTVSNTACEVIYYSGATVLERPVISLLGASSICIGGTTQFSPNSGGTWSAMPPSIASIDAAGIVTGITQGIATFTFTQISTGCVSSASTPVTVLARPSVAINGPSVICIQATTQLIPASGGSWTSGNPAIATVSSGGLVTGVSAGSTSFIFTNAETGCTSASTSNVTVQPEANISVSGISEVCSGYNTTLSSSSAGTWFSTRSDIAKTSANGLVTGLAPGKVSFYFVDASTSCATYLPDNVITVRNCIDPDINVTMVNTSLTGNVKTNDEVPEGTIYPGTVFLVSRPTGSSSSVQVSGNGSYTFSANMAGLYTYDVMVCLPGSGVNCPVSRLAIQVVNPNTENHNIVSNLDLMYITENQPGLLYAKENDKCISGLTCDIVTDRMSVMTQAKKGTGLFMPDGSVLYTPQSNFVGMDTVRYQVCASDNMSNCRTAQQIITVMASNANRAIAAGDDFFFVNKGNSLPASNVLNNDRETSGNVLTVMAEGTVSNPIVIQAGSYFIDAFGNLSFTPDETFSGTVDIVYTVCNNLNECVKATAHVLVLDNMKLRIRAYLEGALMENTGIRGTENRPLMRDNLRLSPYTGQNHIPAIDPYTHSMEFFDLSFIYEHTSGSDAQRFTEIPDPVTVFSVTGQNAIVDWVFIEVRSPKDYTELLSTRSALIQRDGDIVDLDGISPVEIPGARLDSAYVVVKHRNHLGVMSLKQATSGLIDFTLPSTPTFSFGTSRNDGYNHVNLGQKPDVMDGVMALWGGDFDSNGKVKFVNPEDDQNVMFFDVLTFPTNIEFIANYNFAYGYHQGDFNLNGKTKYDNPDDDKNMLFYQVLFHPLNTNYISNFNFIIEQVPAKK
ncbi:MAG: Ig-like domain-containing protein [Saprospiraceae bacterium]|nr:Ig-like domain-containing protein [Saprospiraceae bacterium]